MTRPPKNLWRVADCSSWIIRVARSYRLFAPFPLQYSFLIICVVPRDSTIAAKLRAAGVIILGKSNLSQWANFRSANSTNGWSAYGGQVFGAYYPQQDPGGSSSGSGVASSIGLALATLGTEVSQRVLQHHMKLFTLGRQAAAF